MTRTLARRAPLGALALLSLALVACGDDDDGATVTPGEVELTDPGAETGRIRLPGTAEVGQRATTSVMVTTDLDFSGPIDQAGSVTVRLDVASQVIEVDAEGGYVVEAELVDGAAIDEPEGADLSAVRELIGVRYQQAFHADGAAGDPEPVDEEQLSATQRSAFEELGDDLQTTSFAFPDEPVGEGATWTASSTIASEGFEVEVPYEYELVSVDGDEYEITIRYGADIDERVEFSGEQADITGTVSGSGRLSGTVANPLVQQASIEQDLDVDIEVDGETLEMVVGIQVEMSPA
jgi:hypothetical protein